MDRKILILLAGLTVLFTECNTAKCLPFEHKWIVGKYLSNDYKDIEEMLSLKKDNTYEYLYIIKNKPVVKIIGTYNVSTNEDPNGTVALENMDIFNIDENNFLDRKDYEKYKNKKSDILDIYYFDNDEYEELNNPDKFTWNCGQLIQNGDGVGDFNRID